MQWRTQLGGAGRKAGLFTAAEEADLENDIGRATVPPKEKVIT
jgi:hypothetical protein